MSASSEFIKQEKVKMINNYISSIDLNVINTNKIAEDLKFSLGEKPAVRINYKSENMVTEDGVSTGKRVEKIESITVVFSNERMVAGKMVPLPVEETFILE